MIMHGQAPGHAYGVEAGRVVGGLDPALHRVHAGVKVVGPDPEEAEAEGRTSKGDSWLQR